MSKKTLFARRTFLKKSGKGFLAGMLGGGGVASSSAAASKLDAQWISPADGDAFKSFAALRIQYMSELDRLPWFEKNAQNELVLRTDMGLPPIFDCHVHLGWRYGLGLPINMQRRSEVQYFYNYETPQDVLFAQGHPTSAEGRSITWEMLTTLLWTPERNRSQTAANLSAEMDRMQCRNACLLPIEIPFFSHHARDTMQAAPLDDRFIPFAAIYPYPWGEDKIAFLEWQFEQGAMALKYHPEFQFMAPDNKHAMALFEWCAANNVLVLAHVGYTGSELPFMKYTAEPERYVKALHAFPNLRMIFAHTGIRRRDAALAVARMFEDQVWLGVSGQPAYAIRDIFKRYDKEKILFGSDWPFHPLPVMIARALVGTEEMPAVREGFFLNNALNLLKMHGHDLTVQERETSDLV